MDSDRQIDSDKTHVKFVDDEILMLRANPSKPNNELPEHVNVLFLKKLEDVDLNLETQKGLRQLLSDHRDTFATSSALARLRIFSIFDFDSRFRAI